jgi:hypothetical protein
MPLHNRATNSSKFSSAPSLAGTCVELQYEDGDEEFGANLPTQGEIIQSFEISDTPGGWHLVWLDESFEFQGEAQAHLMIAARWVARPIKAGEPVPVNIRLVPNVTLIQKGAPDIEKLPFAAKGFALVV